MPKTPNIKIHHSKIEDYLAGIVPLVQSGAMPKFNAMFGDPPYSLISINRRFGKEGSAPVKDTKGEGGAFARASAGFMGEAWDGFESMQHYQAWVTDWSSMALEVLEPGAIVGLFGGSRTYHRLACGLEDAGYEVFDCIMWLYGNGFPKGYDIARGIDKAAGVEGEPEWYDSHHDRITRKKKNNSLMFNSIGDSNYRASLVTDEAKQWDGYLTVLKPAYEPLVLARVPRDGKTYRELALEHNAGALNIGGVREDIDNRYPSNVGLVCTCEGGEACQTCPARIINALAGDGTYEHTGMSWRLDEREASRLFYSAKADTLERSAGLESRCTHPTVKPLTVNEYMARLLLPPADENKTRRLLVPFSGVNSEVIGAMFAGWDEIHGVEMGEDYIRQGQDRLAFWSQFDSIAAGKRHYKGDQKEADDTAGLYDKRLL